MIDKKYFIESFRAILAKMFEVKKPQRDYLVQSLILFLSIRRWINFLGLERHSKGVYKESRYSNQFEDHFDFTLRYTLSP